MDEVFRMIVFNALLKGLGIVVSAQDELEGDKAAFQALIKQEFGNHVGLEEGLQLIRRDPTSRLRDLPRWLEGARLTRVSPADEYRDSEAMFNRLLLRFQQSPSLENLLALWLAHLRFLRAQRVYPLSKVAPVVAREKRAKAAIEIQPEDLSIEAQHALVEFAFGSPDKGRNALARLAAEGDPSSRHIHAILCRIHEDECTGINRLATKIERAKRAAKELAETGRASAKAPRERQPSRHARRDNTTDVPATAQDDEGTLQALATLEGWVKRSASWILEKFREENGEIVFSEPISNGTYAAAYAIAGKHPKFQAFIRQLRPQLRNSS